MALRARQDILAFGRAVVFQKADMTSVICKRSIPQPGTTTAAMERPGRPVVFRQVPTQICPDCGGRYLDAKVVEAVYTGRGSRGNARRNRRAGVPPVSGLTVRAECHTTRLFSRFVCHAVPGEVRLLVQPPGFAVVMARGGVGGAPV
jgi:YgiT-type zinc finger domain-containing protein